ncbi:hypothetical protein M885DRAFT_625647, partial [Pelagophyceae sp. CCMP2097]
MGERSPPPAAGRVLEEIQRLEGVTVLTPIISVLGFFAPAAVSLLELKRSYFAVSTQVNPKFGGVQYGARAGHAQAILSRAYALALHAAEYDSFSKGTPLVMAKGGLGTLKFDVPATLLFTVEES